jgi:hypothetical protein
MNTAFCVLDILDVIASRQKAENLRTGDVEAILQFMRLRRQLSSGKGGGNSFSSDDQGE